MCGRFSATFEFREIKIRWNLQRDLPLLAPRYNIAPSQPVPVVLVDEDGVRTAKQMQWGLVPSWLQDRSVGQRMINARAGTLRERPSFKQLVGRQHCIIPADGFYEWRREGSRKVPMWIHLKNKEPFAFAGLWDVWLDPSTGEPLYSFAIITTEANALLHGIHNRMPVILDRLGGEQWLDHLFDARQMTLAAVLRPIPSERMEMHDVSPLVNSPENDTPECIEAVSARNASRLPLFDKL